MKIDPTSYVPIYEQIKEEIKRQISLQTLRPDESLPTIRDLAQELILNPNTVARAYRELESEGFIYTRKGKGSFVTGDSKAIVQGGREALLNRIFDKAIEEASSFGFEVREIRGIFERRLVSASSLKEKTKGKKP